MRQHAQNPYWLRKQAHAIAVRDEAWKEFDRRNGTFEKIVRQDMLRAALASPLEEQAGYYFGCTDDRAFAYFENAAGLFIEKQHMALELRDDCEWA